MNLEKIEEKAFSYAFYCSTYKLENIYSIWRIFLDNCFNVGMLCWNDGYGDRFMSNLLCKHVELVLKIKNSVNIFFYKERYSLCRKKYVLLWYTGIWKTIAFHAVYSTPYMNKMYCKVIFIHWS